MKRLACVFSLFGFFISGTSAQTVHLDAKFDTPVPLESATACDGGAQIAGVGNDGALYVWTPPAPAPRKLVFPEGNVHRCVCGSGKTLLTAFDGGKVLVLDSTSGKVHLSVDAKHGVHALAVSLDGSLLAIGANRAPTQVWDAHTGKPLFITTTSKGGSFGVAFSPNSELIVSLDEDAFIRGYDRSGKLLFTTHDGLLQLYNVMFTGDGKQFAVTGAAGGISLFDSSSGKRVSGAQTTGNPSFESTISPDSKHILAIGMDDYTMAKKAVTLWDLHSETAEPLAIELKNLIGLGANKSNLLVFKQDSPKTLSIYSIQ